MSSTVRMLTSVMCSSLFSLALTGCGDEVTDHLPCSAASECVISTHLSGGQAATECCAGYCVTTAIGCDTGYRYIRSDRDVGECVPTATCPTVMREADMSVAEDLSGPITEEPDAGQADAS